MPEETGPLWHRREPADTGLPGREPAGALLVGRPAVPVRVYLRRTAWDTIDEWTTAFPPPREVGGLLLGQAWRRGREAVILIEGVLPAVHGATRKGPFRLTHEDWVGFRRGWERLGASHAVVGWFHTHPGAGTSLSEYDRLVARRFFPEWWQVTYIIDPVNLRQAVFHWRDGDLAPLAGFWVYDSDEPPVTDPLAPPASTVAAAAAAAGPGASRLPAAVEPRRRTWNGAWTAAFLILAAFAWVPGLPGSLPWLRAALVHQTTEAGRLAAELSALQDRHALLQQVLAEARATATAADTSGPDGARNPAPAATTGANLPPAAAANPNAQTRADGASRGAGVTAHSEGAASSPASAGAGQPGAAAPAPDAPGFSPAPNGSSGPGASPAPGGAASAFGAAGTAPVAETTRPEPPTVLATPPGAGLFFDSGSEELRYVVREGDTLWSISGRLLGDPRAYSRLAAANRIANPDLILPGWELRVPPVEQPLSE